MTRRTIAPDGLADSEPHHFSPGVVADGTLYVSGQVGTDENGRYVGDDIESQARQAFANVETLLAAVDRDLDDIVKVTSYVVDIRERYDDYHAVYRETFPERPFPCHTALGVESLASEDPIVEIEVEVPVDEAAL
ncbi:2-iminobutanoate/2-iminopropanoate deaminase [Natronoarchaeum philippinense]|uniref:2-iminobutanoate/2-iminopropanoate deaminase n=1 Tax=Natronoarchaeum philippinense TaxID=558529 RepID=A0A285NTC2_NATPI|nr:RidA family protein [Natronoarchaeum philippinense]SNZ12742.1 2-iminobutanoate/2-iminopropanoate deaminase [Natronoarchaeum philippinense]